MLRGLSLPSHPPPLSYHNFLKIKEFEVTDLAIVTQLFGRLGPNSESKTSLYKTQPRSYLI